MSGSLGAGVIEQFLVAIGYQVDEQSRQSFLKGLDEGIKRIGEFGSAIEEAALAVKAGVIAMADHFEGLYFASQRIGASVQNIEAFQYAVSQMGGTAEGARTSLESLGRFIRQNPGAEGLFKGLGIATRDARGNMRDTVDIANDFFAKTRNMQAALGYRYASLFGMDEKTFLAGRAGLLQYQQQYTGLQNRAGFNPQQAAADSRALMVQVRQLEVVLEVLAEKVWSSLIKGVGGSVKQLRQWVDVHFDDIARVITQVINIVLQLARDFTWLVAALIPEGMALTRWVINATGGWQNFKIVALAAVAALWLMISPLSALGAGIMLVLDDFRAWQQGAPHFLPWDVWKKDFDAFKAWLAQFRPDMEDFKKSVVEFYHSLVDLGHALADIITQAGTAVDWHKLFDKDAIASDLHAIIHDITEFIHVLTLAVRLLTALASRDPVKIAAALNDIVHEAGVTPPAGEADSIRENLRRQGGASTGPISALWQWGKRKFGFAAPEMTEAQEKLARESYDYWRSKGFTREGASSLVAREWRESGFDWSKRGDNNKAGGSFQWHDELGQHGEPGRRTAIKNVTGIDVWNPSTSHRDQLDALYNEMLLGLDPGAGAAFAGIKNARDTRSGSDLVVRRVERPADIEGESAATNAQAMAIFDMFGPDMPDMGGTREPLPAFHATNVSPWASDATASRERFKHWGGMYPDPDRARPVTISQKVDIHVNGAGDPSAVASKVLQGQSRASADIVRNTKTAAQ